MVDRGKFVLHSFVEPPVTAGRYQLRGTQPIPELPVAEHAAEVTVSSPRYVMPPDKILSTFPPAMAQGDFGSRLPQIVLKRRTLPWERDPGGPARAPNEPPRPWLALVVIAEGEGALSPEPAPVDQCVTAGTTLPDATDVDSPTGYYLTVTETVVNKVFPTVEDLPLLVHVREVDISDTELANGDDDGWLAVVLANRLPIATPQTDPDTGEDVSAPVKYLACLVNLEGQIDALPTDADLATDDTFNVVAQVADYSVAVMAARTNDQFVMGTGVEFSGTKAVAGAAGVTNLAAAPAISAPHSAAATWTAASVSSASATTSATVLGATDGGVAVRKDMAIGFAAQFEAFVLERTYRFPVLAHWSFTATNEGDFQSLCQALDVGLIGTEIGTVLGPDPAGGSTTPVEHLNTPRPGDPPRPQPPEVTETGHVGLPQTTRRGDTASAWYRGPLVPLPTERDPIDAPMAHVSDELRTVTPSGQEDVSQAGAFEIGRLIGLSQPALVRALTAWRAEQFGAARARVLGSRLTGAAFPVDVEHLAGDLGRVVGMEMVAAAGRDPGTTVGASRPVADPGRPVGLRRALDTVVATGLGLDLDRITEKAKSVGMAAALASTEVTVAHSDGALDPAVLDGLRSTLDGELTRLAGAAMPTVETRPKAGRRRAGPPEVVRDALDDVIAAAANDDDGDAR
jgi:hypothetical protein